MSRFKLVIALAIAATALALPTVGHSATAPDLAVGVAPMTDDPMTDAEAFSYMSTIDGSLTRYKCATAHAHSYLYERTTGHHIADLYNTTKRCWYPSTGTLVNGSIRVFPSQTHDVTYSTQDRYVKIGYPFGYKTTRRNTCVHMTVKWELTQLNTWSLFAKIQVRGSGTVYTGNSLGCYDNISTVSW